MADKTREWAEIIGKKVYDQNKKLLGIVKEIEYSTHQSILVVTETKTKKEIMIPYINKFVVKVTDTVTVNTSGLEEDTDA